MERAEARETFVPALRADRADPLLLAPVTEPESLAASGSATGGRRTGGTDMMLAARGAAGGVGVPDRRNRTVPGRRARGVLVVVVVLLVGSPWGVSDRGVRFLSAGPPYSWTVRTSADKQREVRKHEYTSSKSQTSRFTITSVHRVEMVESSASFTAGYTRRSENEGLAMK